MIFDKNKKIEAIEFIDDVFSKEKRVKIDIFREKRTLDQNKLYWLWLTCISVQTGNEKEDLHEYFVYKFLEPELVQVFDKTIYKRLSTKQLDTRQFAEYLNKIQIFANTELTIELPNPEDLKFTKFYEYYKNYI